MTTPLPERPDARWLRKRAKDVRRANPGWSLMTAQLHLAREHGFPSWPKLVAHVERLRGTSRPDEVPEQADPAAEFLRLACLTYGADDPARWARAAALAVATEDVWGAAARCNAAALRRLLAGNRKLASREGGPFGWPPLLYLAFARHDPHVSADAVRDAVLALREAGADVDARYWWHGLEPPFTALTGAFGGGEQSQPPHPQADALARVLLDEGADPNDGQALYNRMFTPDDSHLELLLEYGLDDPELLRDQLGWAVLHGFDDRVRLLVAHGVDPDTEVGGGYGVPRQPAVTAAAEAGHAGTAALLRELGARPAPTSVVAAVLAGDPVDPAQVPAAIAARPGLVAWAAAAGNPDAVRRAVALGWDVDRRARTDVPSDEEWETGLHAAAMNGDRAMVELLLSLGADPTVVDHRFGGTPAQWAAHGGHPELEALLSDRSG
ncbi:ankyrin repeat domain-containing protein [Nocardioides anomalus]|uniref:Ankyrin repeat domain-containing protein n=1 Tax=Nocardioides anomalus TaxID=2712223 RepID=A0A6G6WGY3_9ACTN|nr:ankyrin repeat domain-containing protein [Nocardioides anomalus]QIG44417.1 ankyrin repeat domain-containing protein [Nocardioides anomalus]